MRGTEVSEFIDSAYTWQERATKAEAEVERLKTENAKLRAALNKLARLGNEPNYGNSDGNMIARQALAELDKEGE